MSTETAKAWGEVARLYMKDLPMPSIKTDDERFQYQWALASVIADNIAAVIQKQIMPDLDEAVAEAIEKQSRTLN